MFPSHDRGGVAYNIVVPDCQHIIDVTVYENLTQDDITAGVQIVRTNPDTVDITLNKTIKIDVEILYITA